MKTIQACVNPRLLKKADRLFTGSLDGRICEVLQNARRAHATRVEITNEDGRVTVRDNGHGIQDFAKLLDLGGSGWDESIEFGEDPAGVGLFCLAPREVSIRSKGSRVNIGGTGWSGALVSIQDDPNPIAGTELRFWDEPWRSAIVDRHAVFSGMDVVVDGVACPRRLFVSAQATRHPELGCLIEVLETAKLNEWHNACHRDRLFSAGAMVNFHGQIVELPYSPVSERGLHYLVDLTGEPTAIRLMLPARTRLFENAALIQLKAAIEREAYRFIQRRGSHCLPFREFERARELGIHLPEARPAFTVGLLSACESPEPVEVRLPKDFPLSKCYRVDSADESNDSFAVANAHLLAALGTLETPFVPVEIRSDFDGYAWARLPTITRVEITIGAQLYSDWIGGGRLTCVDRIVVTVHTSDGRIFSSPVCMAKTAAADETTTWPDEVTLVTPDAQERLSSAEIWHHLGGWSEDGDTYDTQEYEFSQALDGFWAELIGPDENIRRELVRDAEHIKPEWHSVTILCDGTVTIQYADGQSRAILPPPTTSTSL